MTKAVCGTEGTKSFTFWPKSWALGPGNAELEPQVLSHRCAGTNASLQNPLQSVSSSVPFLFTQNLRSEKQIFRLHKVKSFGKSGFVIMFNLHIPHQRKGQGSQAENTAVQAAQLIASPSSTSFIFISSQLYQIINSLCCIRVLIPFIQAALDSGR